MEKASDLLARLMLGLFALVLTLAMLLTALRGLTNRSYLAAMALGGVAAAAVLLALRRAGSRPGKENGLFRRLGPVGTGAALAALCFAVNLIWVLAVRIEPFSDYNTYWRCACSLAFGSPMESTEYVAMYPHILGYASFLSLFLRLFGESVMAAAVLNVALTTVSGLLIYALCRRFLDDGCAALAFLMWTFFPTKLMLNSLVFSEPLYTCQTLLFILLVTGLERRQERYAARPALGLLWGAGLGLLLRWLNTVRPIAAILIIAFFIWLLLLRGGDVKDKRLWRLWGLAALAMLCVYALSGRPWDAHVERVLGEEPADMPIYNVYVGFNEETQGQWSAEDMDLLFAYKHEENISAGEAQRRMLPHLKERLASGIDLPGLFAAKLRAFMGDDELGGYTYRFTRGETFVKVCMVLCNVYYFFAVALVYPGLYGMLRLPRPRAWLLMPLFALGLTLAHMLVEVCNRYHYSLIPMFVIIAAFGFYAVRTRGGKNTEVSI